MAQAGRRQLQHFIVRVEKTEDAHREVIRSVIAKRAYQIFQTRSPLQGSDVEDWHKAERELLHDDFDGNTSEFELLIQHTEARQIVFSLSERSLVILRSGPTGDTDAVLEVVGVHTFPHEIEPSATTVNAGDGVLRVRLRKKSTSNRLL